MSNGSNGRGRVATRARLVVKMSSDAIYDPDASDRPNGVGIYPAGDGEIQIRNISANVTVDGKTIAFNQTVKAGPGAQVRFDNLHGQVIRRLG